MSYFPDCDGCEGTGIDPFSGFTCLLCGGLGNEDEDEPATDRAEGEPGRPAMGTLKLTKPLNLSRLSRGGATARAVRKVRAAARAKVGGRGELEVGTKGTAAGRRSHV